VRNRKYFMKSRVLFISRDSLLLAYVSRWVAYSWGKIQKCIRERERKSVRERKKQAIGLVATTASSIERKKRASIDLVRVCACTSARNKTPWCCQNSRDVVALINKRREWRCASCLLCHPYSSIALLFINPWLSIIIVFLSYQQSNVHIFYTQYYIFGMLFSLFCTLYLLLLINFV
jgi:hypothetical protein